jgi:hypothetical protein
MFFIKLRRTFYISAAAALLAGCGVLPLGSSRGQDDVMPQGPGTAANTGEAGAQALLYVADIAAQEVWIFTYPHGKFVGDLTDAEEPAGECVDKFGDVFVTDYYNGRIFEYSHGATQPLKTLKDPGYLITACAVDSHSGDLAVIGFIPNKERRPMNSVAIFKEAVYKKSPGAPRQVGDPAIRSFISCAYDDMGNLFVDGFGKRGSPNWLRQLGELPQGGRKFTPISLPGGINEAGPLQWNSGYVTMGGERGGLHNARQLIHRLAISGTQAKSAGTTSLDGVVLGGAYFINSGTGTVVTPDADQPRIQIFHYPKGGKNIAVIQHQFKQPVVTVISDPGR